MPSSSSQARPSQAGVLICLRALWRNLVRLEQQDKACSMRISMAKCQILHRGRNNPVQCYGLRGSVAGKLPCGKEAGGAG